MATGAPISPAPAWSVVGIVGGEPGSAYLIAPKPKGMWQRTYQRKRFEIKWCESQADHLFLSKYSYLLSEGEVEMYFGP